MRKIRRLKKVLHYLLRENQMVRKSLNVGLVKNMVILHLNVLRELRSIETISSLEDLKNVIMLMMKRLKQELKDT